MSTSPKKSTFNIRTQRARHAFDYFTQPDGTFPNPIPFNDATMVYYAYVQHRCPTTGNLHWHVFVHFNYQPAFTAVLKMFHIKTSHAFVAYNDSNDI